MSCPGRDAEWIRQGLYPSGHTLSRRHEDSICSLETVLRENITLGAQCHTIICEDSASRPNEMQSVVLVP